MICLFTVANTFLRQVLEFTGSFRKNLAAPGIRKGGGGRVTSAARSETAKGGTSLPERGAAAGAAR